MVTIGTIDTFHYEDKLILSLTQNYVTSKGTYYMTKLFSNITNQQIYQEMFFNIYEAQNEFKRMHNEDILKSYVKEELAIIARKI